MCSKYFDECFMNKHLLQIYLTKFNKLSKRRKHTLLRKKNENYKIVKIFVFQAYGAEKINLIACEKRSSNIVPKMVSF